MVEYTFEEYIEMLIIYGEAGRNGRAAQRIYEERFPNHRAALHFRQTSRAATKNRHSTFLARKADCGAPRTRRTLNFEENLLQYIDIWHVLHENQFHPYHLQKTHALGPADFAPLVIFCAWFLHQCVDHPDIPSRILSTDEALFTREAVLNCRNRHIWDDANPHATQTRAFQERFRINVWAGNIDGHLIGPYVLPHRLTGPRYLTFLQKFWWSY